MFKKIILILILSLIPTNSFAQENYENVDWINFDWDKVFPDQYTINLAKMYGKIDRGIEDKNIEITVTFSKSFDSDKIEETKKHFSDSAIFFSLDTFIAFVNDQSAGVFSNDFLLQNGNGAEPWSNWCSSFQELCGGAYKKFRNMKTSQSYLYVNTNNDQRYKESGAVIHHESAHLYIFDMTRRELDNYQGLDLEFNCWITEGLANTLGFTSYTMSGNYYDIRKDKILSIKEAITNIDSIDKTDLISYFIKNQDDRKFCFNKGGAYSIGMLLVEYLYTKYEFNEVNSFFQFIELESSKYWKHGIKAPYKIFGQGLSQTFNLEEKDFFSEAFDYVKESYSRALTS